MCCMCCTCMRTCMRERAVCSSVRGGTLVGERSRRPPKVSGVRRSAAMSRRWRQAVQLQNHRQSTTHKSDSGEVRGASGRGGYVSK